MLGREDLERDHKCEGRMGREVGRWENDTGQEGVAASLYHGVEEGAEHPAARREFWCQQCSNMHWWWLGTRPPPEVTQVRSPCTPSLLSY